MKTGNITKLSFKLKVITLAILLTFALTTCSDGSDNGGRNGGNGGNGNGDNGNSTGNGNSNSGSSGGTFTLNGIPSEYNGKYAYLLSSAISTMDDSYFIGVESYEMNKYLDLFLPQISNGSVSIPLWKDNFVRYSGNDVIELGTEMQGIYPLFGITFYDTPIVTANEVALWTLRTGTVSFNNGNVTKSWSDGTLSIY